MKELEEWRKGLSLDQTCSLHERGVFFRWFRIFQLRPAARHSNEEYAARLMDMGEKQSHEVARRDDRQLPGEHQGPGDLVNVERHEADEAQAQGDHEVERRLERVEMGPPLPLRKQVEGDEQRQDESGTDKYVDELEVSRSTELLLLRS